jgi:hypothetical protein
VPRELSKDDVEYLAALKQARLAIVRGAQSYRVGSRSLTRADLPTILSEIARLEGTIAPRFRRVVVTDQ